MNFINNWRNKINKYKYIKIMVAITTLASFTICIFAPLELYRTNMDEYWFDIYCLLPIILKAFIVTFLIIFVFFILISFLPCSFLNIIITFVFSTLLSLYLQGNFVKCDYGVLDGRDIQWNSYLGYAISSILIWGICLVCFQILLVKLKFEKVSNAINYMCIFIFLIEVITLCVLLIPKGFEKKQSASMTTENLFELSSKENVIVLVLDAFDSAVFKELLEKNETNNILKDFTYYPDTVGMYSTTKASIPYMLTGKRYLNQQKFSSYVESAYAESDLYTYLSDNDYRVDIYSRRGEVPQKIDVGIDNLVIDKPVIQSESEKKQLSAAVYQLVAYKYVPHQLKKYFWLDTSEFDIVLPENVYNPTFQLKVWDKLINERVTVSDNSSCFKFYHVMGNHKPYRFNSKLEPLANGEKVTEIEVALGNMKFVEEFLNQLKSQNIYDKSAILILADHGAKDMNSNPLLLSKNYDEEHEDIKISNAPISYEDIYPTLEFLSGMEPANKTIFDIEENRARERHFYWYEWNIDWTFEDYMPEMVEYIAEDTADHLAEYIPTGKRYNKGGVTNIKRYQVSTEDVIYFNGDEKYDSFVGTGFTSPSVDKNDEKYAWSLGAKSRIEFECENISKDIKMIFKGSPINEKQQIIYYINDEKVGEISNIKDSFEIILPAELLKEGTNKLVLQYPNAISPKEMGVNEDVNQYSFMYRSVKIEQ